MVYEEIDEMERMITPYIIAKRLMITPNSVIAAIKQGKIKAHKVGRLWKIRETDYEEYLKSTEYEPDEA